MTAAKRVVVLISGRGSNMRALVEAARATGYPAGIVAVIANEPDAAGLDYARTAGLPTATVAHRDFADRPSFDSGLDAAIRRHDPDLVCLAGFMRLLTPGFIAGWHDRLLNIHPSLLPAFRGLHTHRRALEAGVKIAGCTVHFVRPEVDTGPIIAQAAVPVLPGDTEDSLAARVLEQEHILYPMVLRLVAEGRVTIDGDRAVVDAPGAETALRNPALP